MEEVIYKFFATGVTGIEREVFPKNGNTFAMQWEKPEERAFFSKKLDGKLLFDGDDFNWFYTFEKSQYRCVPIYLRIEKLCSGTYSDFFEARLILNKGTFDLDQCQLEIEATPDNKYTCYDEKADEERNLFSIVDANETISLAEGELEFLNCTGTLGVDPEFCSSDVGYILNKRDISSTDGITFTFNNEWVREKKTSLTPLSAPWISIGGDEYVKTPAQYGLVIYNSDENNFGFRYKVGGTIDHGMKLQDIVEGLLNLACPGLTLKSDFFQWNPDVVSTVNYVTGQASKVLNLILFQKSDVKRPDSDQNATMANIQLDKLIVDLCNTFYLKWDIDDDNRFVIEHVSFFNKNTGLNLAGRYDQILRVGTNKYSYDVNNIPLREVFFMLNDETINNDFKGKPIIYNNDCAGTSDLKEKEWRVENYLTDLGFVLAHPDPDDSFVTDEGFVLIACDSLNNILFEESFIGGNYLNNTLSWTRLHEDYWRYEKYFPDFLMNGFAQTALSIIPTKKQVPINVQLCCDDFAPDELITTQLGEGTVAEASYNLYSGILTLTLLYDANEGLMNNTAPVAVNDNAIVYINEVIDVDVLANDTDDGTINPLTLEITTPPTNGMAVIVANKIRYTPNADYVGNDSLQYRVRDTEWNQTSNVATVNITVKALPVAVDDNFTTGKNISLSSGNLLTNDSGDGTITAVAEIKTTAQGGTVEIFSNGNFNYTPPVDFVGDDSFDYTIEDDNSNTATGTATIEVFNTSTVYVSMDVENENSTDKYLTCDEEPNIVGYEILVDLLFRFYSDPAGTIPLDITGYSLTINIDYSQDTNGDVITGSFTHFANSGNTSTLANQLKETDFINCEAVHTTITRIYSLGSSSDYVIL